MNRIFLYQDPTDGLRVAAVSQRFYPFAGHDLPACNRSSAATRAFWSMPALVDGVNFDDVLPLAAAGLVRSDFFY